MLTQNTENTQTTSVEGAQIHGRENVTSSTHGTHEELFTCRDCGNNFTRAEAAKPSSKIPTKCAECQRKNRADAKAERKTQEVKSKKVGNTDRYTFSLDQLTNIAIDTLAVGRDRSTVVEEAIAMMLAANPAAKAYVEYQVAMLQK